MAAYAAIVSLMTTIHNMQNHSRLSTSIDKGQIESLGEKTNVAGFEGYFDQLLDWLTAEQSDQQIIPVTGLGGIGKTTLARKVYDDLLIVQHFYVRALLTISQEYDVRQLLFHTLSSLGKSTEELVNKTEDELGVLLHKFLYGRRYLIILDDMWSIESWEKMSFYFPREERRSRIVVTTRQSEVPRYFSQNLRLPSSLKKLALPKCQLKWDDLTKIGSLPHLQVLKLELNSVIGTEWNPIEGEFQRLKYLQISDCYDLRQWNAESCHSHNLQLF